MLYPFWKLFCGRNRNPKEQEGYRTFSIWYLGGLNQVSYSFPFFYWKWACMAYIDKVVRGPPSGLTMFWLALAAVAVWSLSVFLRQVIILRCASVSSARKQNTDIYLEASVCLSTSFMRGICYTLILSSAISSFNLLICSVVKIKI